MAPRVRLPPLHSLRAFHALMRKRSLREAGEELFVSAQAIGQQIRQLEEALGVTLIERDGRTIRFTEKANAFARYIDAAFAEIEEGVLNVTGPGLRHHINLNVSPYFGTRYLMPRLPEFRIAVPDAEIGLTTMIDVIDLDKAQIDLAVQWGFGAPADMEGHLLLRDPKVICCKPEMAEKINVAQDLLNFNLLQPARAKRLWHEILGFLGVEAPVMDRSLTFDDAATMRRATYQGMGIGLISRLDAEEDLASGKLVAPLGKDVLIGMAPAQVPGFYLITTKAKLRARHVSALHRWLLAQSW